MSFYEKQRDGVAARLINKYGLSMTLRRVIKGKNSAAQGVKEPSTSTEYSCKGIIEEYRIKDVDGTLVKQGDKKVILAASKLAIRPQTDDLLIIENAIWKVVTNKPTSPGGVDIIHNLQIRS